MNSKAKMAVGIILYTIFITNLFFTFSSASASDFVLTQGMKNKIIKDNTYVYTGGADHRVEFVKFLDIIHYDKYTTFIAFERDFFLIDMAYRGLLKDRRETLFAVVLHNSSGKWKINEYLSKSWIESSYPDSREKLLEAGYF